MSTDDPKPTRRIPDEGLFTVHFVNVGRGKATFDAHIPEITGPILEDAMRKGAAVMSPDITFLMVEAGTHGDILAGFHTIGTFTITPPTLKGDPDEPT